MHLYFQRLIIHVPIIRMYIWDYVTALPIYIYSTIKSFKFYLPSNTNCISSSTGPTSSSSRTISATAIYNVLVFLQSSLSLSLPARILLHQSIFTPLKARTLPTPLAQHLARSTGLDIVNLDQILYDLAEPTYITRGYGSLNPDQEWFPISN